MIFQRETRRRFVAETRGACAPPMLPQAPHGYGTSVTLPSKAAPFNASMPPWVRMSAMISLR